MFSDGRVLRGFFESLGDWPPHPDIHERLSRDSKYEIAPETWRALVDAAMKEGQ